MLRHNIASKLARGLLQAQQGAGSLPKANFARFAANQVRTKVYGVKPVDGTEYVTDQSLAGDHSGRQQNHIWSKDEIDEQLQNLYRHRPATFGDKVVQSVVSEMSFVSNHIPSLIV